MNLLQQELHQKDERLVVMYFIKYHVFCSCVELKRNIEIIQESHQQDQQSQQQVYNIIITIYYYCLSSTLISILV